MIRADFRRPAGRLAALAALTVTALSLGGCASSAVNTVWRDPSYTAPPLRNLLVVAVRKDGLRRRLWEDALVAQISKRGAKATASYTLFPDDIPDTLAVVEAVRKNGYDGVVVNLRRESQQRQRYVPGTTTVTPVTGYDPFWGMYYRTYETVHEPGYVETEEYLQIETEVVAATPPRGHHIWTCITDTVNPPDVQALSNEMSKLLIPQMVKDRIIP